MSAAPEQLAPELWRWTARHPEWHPGEFGREVACFALRAGDEAILIDPLLPEEQQEPVLELIERILGRTLWIFITIPYHVRSSEAIWRRYRDQTETAIHGHAAAAKRLGDRTGFKQIEPDTELPAGITAHAIGKPRRYEMPLHIPSHRALAFGDAVVETDGRLAVWATKPIDDQVERFYRARFNPTLEPLLDLAPQRILVTHGEPVLEDGRTELAAALAAPPWYRHG